MRLVFERVFCNVDGGVGRFGVAAPFLVAFFRQADRRIHGIPVHLDCHTQLCVRKVHLRLIVRRNALAHGERQ
jgi:hypothetical protein